MKHEWNTDKDRVARTIQSCFIRGSFGVATMSTRVCVIAAVMIAVALGSSLTLGGRADADDIDVNTFSIVAFDPVAKEWGCGVASKVIGVGAIVPWAKTGVGAVATQALSNR